MRLQFSVAVGGTHGKTTTTSMVAALLDAGGLDPTVVNGGIINAYGTNAKVGEGDWIVVEADESDGTFLKLKSTVRRRHQHRPRAPGPLRRLRRREEGASRTSSRTSRSTASRRSAPTTRRSRPWPPASRTGRLVTYGTNPQAEVRVVQHQHGAGRRQLRRRGRAAGRASRSAMTGLHLPMAGHHNVLNATGRRGRGPRAGRRRRRHPQGPGRVRRGEAPLHHHGRRQRRPRGRRLRPPPGRDRLGAEGRPRGRRSGKVIAVVQPHRYTRLRDLFDRVLRAASTTPTR